MPLDVEFDSLGAKLRGLLFAAPSNPPPAVVMAHAIAGAEPTMVISQCVDTPISGLKTIRVLSDARDVMSRDCRERSSGDSKRANSSLHSIAWLSIGIGSHAARP